MPQELEPQREKVLRTLDQLRHRIIIGGNAHEHGTEIKKLHDRLSLELGEYHGMAIERGDADRIPAHPSLLNWSKVVAAAKNPKFEALMRSQGSAIRKLAKASAQFHLAPAEVLHARLMVYVPNPEDFMGMGHRMREKRRHETLPTGAPGFDSTANMARIVYPAEKLGTSLNMAFQTHIFYLKAEQTGK